MAESGNALGSGPSDLNKVLRVRPSLPAPVARWWNWYTRRIQNPVLRREGSMPSRATIQSTFCRQLLATMLTGMNCGHGLSTAFTNRSGEFGFQDPHVCSEFMNISPIAHCISATTTTTTEQAVQDSLRVNGQLGMTLLFRTVDFNFKNQFVRWHVLSFVRQWRNWFTRQL